MHFKCLVLIFVLFVLTSCTTPEKEPGREIIDIVELQKNLAMNKAKTQLGIHQIKFNTCDAGAGYPSHSNCRNMMFSLVHFRLQCRDDDSEMDVDKITLTNIASESVKWKVGPFRGVTKTDSEGYGQFAFASFKNPKYYRMILTNKSKYLGVRANEARRFIVPSKWCH